MKSKSRDEQGLVDEADRSHRDRRYSHAANAIDLFRHTWFPAFPTPQSISERLREELILARATIKRTKGIGAINPATTTEPSASGLGDEQTVDNESRELILIGDMFSLVGKAGHIFRPIPNSDWGIDGEIEFKDSAGRASGRRVYVQLKSGDSHLVPRIADATEIFAVKNLRHLEYWAQQAYPVMLVIRRSSGMISWMDVSEYVKRNGLTNRRIIFRGELLTPDSIQRLAKASHSPPMTPPSPGSPS